MCQRDQKNIPEVGTLYLIDGKLNIKKKLSSVSISNGLDWCGDNKIFYYIDTPTDKVVAYDFDVASGNICKKKRDFKKSLEFRGVILKTKLTFFSANKRVIIDTKEKGFQGHPDGMTIDTDGNLWVALVHGSKVSIQRNN